MNDSILKTMVEIVEAKMKSYKTDFYKYNLPYLQEEATEESFPMIWLVGESHTHLLRLGEYKKRFFTEECVRYCYAAGNDTFSYHFNPRINCLGDCIYLLTSSEIREITPQMALSAIKDITTSVVCGWKEKHGPLPKKTNVTVRFCGPKPSTIIALLRECEEHGDTSLHYALRSFRGWTKKSADHVVNIYYDPAYRTFRFEEIYDGKYGICGAIKFHRWPETGHISNGSVQIDPRYGWSQYI